MTRFSLFALLYMTAVLLELVERWRHPVAASATLVLALAIFALGITRTTFLVFLAWTTAYFVFFLFPDVANHVNVIIYCNLLLMAGIGYSLARREAYPGDEDAYDLVRPVLQASMILVYVLAGFAKLNTDFFDPAVSCVGAMTADLARLRFSDLAGIPMFPLLLGGVLLAADRLHAVRRGPASRWVRVGAAVLVALAFLPSVRQGITLPESAARLVVLGMAALVVLWELVGGALLAVPAMQAPVLAFSWTMHASLALIGFVDFGALALALLFTFLPVPWARTLHRPVRLPLLPRTLPRPGVFFAICLLAGVCSAMGRRLPAGVLFDLAAIVLLWPLLETAAARAPRPEWRGSPLSPGGRPRWLLAFPLLLLLHGLTAYAGLRTAGNFTMFSNLRTEGDRSNHLLLGGNPLKVWDYQEDAVRFIGIDDDFAAIGYQYQALEGNRLPLVEFRKLIQRWTDAGLTVPLVFEYRGRVHRTEDIVSDPVWRARGWDWEMRLMDFRVIQGEGANRCRW